MAYLLLILGVIIGTCALAWFVSVLVDEFINSGQREHIDNVLKGLVYDGINFMGLAALGLSAIVMGSTLLDEIPGTQNYLGWLIFTGFIAFYMSQFPFTGPVFRVLVFVGVSTRLAIMAIVSLHFISPNLERLTIHIAALYTLILLTLRDIRYKREKNQPRPCHKDCLEKTVECGLNLTTFGMGFLVIGALGNLIEKSPSVYPLVAVYTGGSFWVFYGCKLLGRCVLYEIFVLMGAIMAMAMVITPVSHVLLGAGYEFPVFVLLTVAMSLSFEWSRILKVLEKLV